MRCAAGFRDELLLLLRLFALSVCCLPFLDTPSASDDHRLPVILVFGDSFTAGFGIAREAAFPAQLENWLQSRGKAARVINAGKSGDTTENALPRLDKALAEHPDIVILELGANDALRGINPSITRANLVTMISRFQAGGARVLLTGILAPPNWGEEYGQAFDRIYPEIARSSNVPLYPFFLQGVAPDDPQLNQRDGLHPNERGVTAIVNRLGPVIVRLFLDEAAPAAPR